MRWGAFAAALLLAAGGASAAEPPRVRAAASSMRPQAVRAAARPARASLGRSLARRAGRLVGHRSLRDVSRAFPDDCSGFVRYVYAQAGLDPLAGRAGATESGSVAAQLYRRGRERRSISARGRPGDLVFFHDTYDRNRDGRIDDGITHVGVVESVAPDGQVTFIHRASTGIVRSRLDPRHPRLRSDGLRRVRNDVLRRPDRTHRAYLTGELLVGYARPKT